MAILMKKQLIPLFLSVAVVAHAQNPEKPVTPPAQTPPLPTIVPTNLFQVPEGMEITVWATTPQLYNPTNIDFDKDGRLWVAEGVTYRGHPDRRPAGDRIVVLEDTTGSGVADKSTTFIQDKGLVAPLGIAVLDDKIIVSQPPDLLVYTDVNGDRVFDPAVDKKEVLLTGFKGRDHDHSLHSLTAGPDGLWYFNQGNTGAKFTDRSGKTFRMGCVWDVAEELKKGPDRILGVPSDDGHIYIGGFGVRMNPDGTNVEIIGHNYRNSYEQTITSLGDVFQNDNDDPPACRVSAVMEYGNAGYTSADGMREWGADIRPGQETAVAEWRQEDPGTMPAGDVYGGGAPTGITFYENGALGDQWRGLLLSCEAGKNVVFGYLPKADKAGFKLERFDFVTSNKEKKFAGSDFLGGQVSNEMPTLFRPSDVTVGPDGAIYVADWFDARVGGHATFDGTMSGTIYRIAPKGFISHVPKIDLATTEGQIQALKSPTSNVRYSGFTRLKAQGDKAIPAVAALLQDSNPFIAARAVWLLAQMGPAGTEKVTALLASPDDSVRLVAYRALRRAGYDILGMAAKEAKDKSPAIRREAALTMRDLPLDQSRDILVEVGKQFDGKDRAYLEALGTGSYGKEKEIYADLAKVMGTGPAEDWSDAFAWIAWRLGSPDAVAGLKARALSPKLSREQRKLAMTGIAFIKTQEAALAMIDLAQAEGFADRDTAKWWLNSRKDNDWKPFGLTATLRERGIIKDEQLVSIVSPEPPKESKLPPLAEILALKGDPKAGEAAIAACYTCHKIGKQGADVGPNLTEFGKTQTREVILNAIVNPSAEISHGYDAWHIVTNDGITVDGIVIGDGDPLVIKSVGGQVQHIQRDRIKSKDPLGRSLMFSADMLGMSPQTLADVVAYLKTDIAK